MAFNCGIKEMKRIQRKRSKGWKSPSKTRFCGRGTKYGNPYKVIAIESGKYLLLNTKNKRKGETIHSSKELATKKAVQMFGWWIERKYTTEKAMKEFLAPLREYDYLSCWCREDAKHCHVDYLISLINKFWEDGE